MLEKLLLVLVDTSATHNFILEDELNKLSLKLEKDLGHMKVVNFKAVTIVGVVKEVVVKFSSWQGKVNFMIV